MRIPGLSTQVIEERAEKGSIDRGKEYQENGAVKSLKRRSATEVEAFVQGTDVAPYRVDVHHNADGITTAECTCPYVTGSWCRHIVAALFAVLETSGKLSRPISEILEEFDRTELVRLIERLLMDHPETAATVEEAYQQKLNG